MNSYKSQLIVLFKQIVFLFVVYTICRLLFYAFNYSSFQDLSLAELCGLLFYGLRFDSFSIAATNALYILLCILPFRFYYSNRYQSILSIIFIITNALAIALNFIDLAYFPFTQKRTTYEVFHLIFGGQTEFLRLLPHFLADYWYLLLLYTFFIILLSIIHFRIKKTETPAFINATVKRSLSYFLIFTLITGATILAIRGGTQKVPIVLVDAANYTSPKYIPILLNTPFSILKSADLTELTPLHIYNEEELEKRYSPIHQADTGAFNNSNVCVIILESFSKEFTGIGNRTSYTPFLDSLMSKSILFTNAFSNGKTSMNSIPAIIASMPCFLENQYLNSVYSNNNLQTLPNLLKHKGYESAFFHGGTNGTINLNSFAKLAGYDTYYGRTEYNNDADYDGQWGIWDEPFLKKASKEMTALKQPFFTSIFSLSSHNPYKVPEKYKGKFPKGNYEITESIGYADFSLQQFFAEASRQPWFDNTLFVITADHTSISDDAFYSNALGQYSIPIMIYKKDIAPKIESNPIQQMDIMPSILDYLNYDKPYYALGKSIFSDTKQPAIYYVSPNFYCVQDSFIYILSKNEFIEKYNYKQDSLMTTNILDKRGEKELQDFCNAFIQKYTNDVIGNKTVYKEAKHDLKSH
jgi:phosphoglycerol transferase MdoB-like AlkP superfamily enzyme